MYTFIETKLFTRLVDEYLSDEEYSALQWALVANPAAGDLVRGPAVFGRSGGAPRAAVSEAGCGLSTMLGRTRARFGC